MSVGTGALSVAQYVEVVNATLSTIPPEALIIEGEVAEYRIAQEKWITFLLKDEVTGDKLPCFATVYQRLPVLQDGARVQVQGTSKINGRFGKYSLNVTKLVLVGEGALRRAYEALKKQLELEGLFAQERKRALPAYPEHIGLITSREAAAYGDFLRIARNRWPSIRMTHVHTQVQGQGAAEGIVAAFSALNSLPTTERPQVIVLTRGGGAFEELHAFNDERVARAVYASALPVLVGVGHERDETLVDFVADVRASTPSNAAERLLPDYRHVAEDIEHMASRWAERLHVQVQQHERTVDRFTQAAAFMTAAAKRRLEHATERLSGTFQQQVASRLVDIKQHLQLLDSYNPRHVLARGYALARLGGGQIVQSTRQAPPGTAINLTLADGTLHATVNPQQSSLL
jgi:exodeoxyribonuclease VII large subunit